MTERSGPLRAVAPHRDLVGGEALAPLGAAPSLGARTDLVASGPAWGG